MKETTMEARSERSMAGQLRLPLQAVPIDRTPAGVALAAGSGIEAAGWWDIAKKIGSGIGAIGDQIF